MVAYAAGAGVVHVDRFLGNAIRADNDFNGLLRPVGLDIDPALNRAGT